MNTDVERSGGLIYGIIPKFNWGTEKTHESSVRIDIVLTEI
jgi:hypothetical protein